MWRVDLVAFQTNLLVYRAIGATIRAYHWEVSGALWWRKERWTEKPVEFLTVRTSYEGMFVGGEPGSGVRSNSAENASACDERLWSAGVALKFEGGPPQPGGFTSLDVRGVRAVGTATINREQLTLPQASTGTVNSERPF
jgi:hypothetical protein